MYFIATIMFVEVIVS